MVEGFFKKKSTIFSFMTGGKFVIVASPEYRFRQRGKVIEDLTGNDSLSGSRDPVRDMCLNVSGRQESPDPPF